MASMKAKILIQLDTDPQPSVFDAVVAVDAGADHLFRHGGVTPENVRDLVYGALFTRGPADLAATAIFIGGSNVAAGEAVLRRGEENVLRAVPGLGSVRRQRCQHDGGRGGRGVVTRLWRFASRGVGGRSGSDRAGWTARRTVIGPPGCEGGRWIAEPRTRLGAAPGACIRLAVKR